MCDEISFDPLCSHENVRYFTPCHAGCTSYLEVEDDVTVSIFYFALNIYKYVKISKFIIFLIMQSCDFWFQEYYNCSCLSAPSDPGEAWASTEPCTVGSCSAYLAVFMVVFFFEVLMVFMCNSMNLSATIR